jgi:hypothetical protein
VLRRQISGRGLLEALFAIVLIAMIVGAIFDRQRRGDDVAAACFAGLVLVASFYARQKRSARASISESRNGEGEGDTARPSVDHAGPGLG